MIKNLNKKPFSILIILILLYFSAFMISCEESDVNPAGNQDTMEDPGGSGNDDTGNGEEDPAPDFVLTSINGDEFKLSELENKVVVLFFLGFNCPSCKAIGPTVEADLHDPYRSNEDYIILGLDQWDGNKASLESFKTTTGVTFPLLLMASEVASEYNTTYDRLIVIGRDGNIKFKGVNNASADIEDVMDLVDSLL